MGNSEKESLTKRIDIIIIVRSEAQLDVQEAFDYYEKKGFGLGSEFLRSLDAALQFVRRNPYSYQKTYDKARRVLLRKFPYALFYIAEETHIVVVACFHQKRTEIDLTRRI